MGPYQGAFGETGGVGGQIARDRLRTNGMVDVVATDSKRDIQTAQKVPNLRQLRLQDLPFTSFRLVNPQKLHTPLLLPHLSDVTITDASSKSRTFPQAVCCDLLKASGHRVSRFKVYGYGSDMEASSTEYELDFGGNLRHLEFASGSDELLLPPSRVDLDSLEGLKELAIDRIFREDTFGQLPSLDRLSTNGRGSSPSISSTATLLARLIPGTLPFKVLEVYSENETEIPAVEAQCKRLGVKFCRRTTGWD